MSSPAELAKLKQRGRASAYATSGASFAQQSKPTLGFRSPKGKPEDSPTKTNRLPLMDDSSSKRNISPRVKAQMAGTLPRSPSITSLPSPSSSSSSSSSSPPSASFESLSLNSSTSSSFPSLNSSIEPGETKTGISAAEVAALPSMNVVVVPPAQQPLRGRTRSMDEVAELLAESQKLLDSGRRRLAVETTLANAASEEKLVLDALSDSEEASSVSPKANARARKLTSAEKLEEDFAAFLILKSFQERTLERVGENMTEFDKNLIMDREGAPLETSKNLYQGWLHRQNGRNMTKYYCVVECGQFRYYTSEGEDKPKGTITLSIAESASAIQHEVLAQSFMLVSGNGKKREETQWTCTTGEDCLRWVACITACILGFPDNAIGADHHCHELTADMMHGLRTILSRHNQQLANVVPSEKDFQEVASLEFPSKGSKITPPHKMGDFGFKDYAPSVFRRLRAYYGISPTEYTIDVSGNLGYTEFISNSRSGEFFFLTHNRKYLIKTISHNECRGLRANISTYYKYMMQNPNTFVNKFCGLHKVKPTYAGSRFCWFLIMLSTLPPELPMHLIFDLKGAMRKRAADRWAKPKEKERSQIVYKDNDLLEQKLTFDVGVLSEPMKAQLAKDFKLLGSLKIVDYSVLCGVHFVGKEDTHSKKESGPQRSALSHYLEEERAARFHASLLRLWATVQDLSPKALLKLTEEECVLAAGGVEGRNFYHLLHGITIPPATGSRSSVVVTPPSDSKAELRQELSVLGFESPNPSIFSSDRGGTSAIIGPNGEKGIVFLGIIDTLLEYGHKKKMESFYKSKILGTDKARFSAAEPDYYAERLREFMAKVLTKASTKS